MAEIHKSWILEAVKVGLVRLVKDKVTINDVPNKGDKHEEEFQRAEFTLASAEDFAKLHKLAEDGKGTIKDKDGKEVPAENPLAGLLGYAYGLNCRSRVRINYEKNFIDPETGIKKIANVLLKTGKFKSLEKAMAAARLMQEDDTE